MAENTKIEWAHHTFNPWEGCQKVGPGCDNCYAEARNARFGGGQAINWGPGAPRRRTSASNWAMPVKWNKQAQAEGTRFRVFCASLADVFDNEVDPAWREDLFRLIEATPYLDWLLLTKRIGNAKEMMFLARGGHLPLLPNVWIGATIVNQTEADRDIPKLLAVPARVRFLSMEPLLGPVDVRPYLDPGHGVLCCKKCGFRTNRWAHEPCPNDGEQLGPDVRIDWVIVGGESGPGARPMHPDWARSLRDQCTAAGVPFLFKQWGEWTPGENVERQRGVIPIASLWDNAWQISNVDLYHDHGHIDDQPDLYRVGKKAAGRLLDGRTWDEVPS